MKILIEYTYLFLLISFFSSGIEGPEVINKNDSDPSTLLSGTSSALSQQNLFHRINLELICSAAGIEFFAIGNSYLLQAGTSINLPFPGKHPELYCHAITPAEGAGEHLTLISHPVAATYNELMD